MLRRRDPKANAGFVRWPTHLSSSGEGGMYVYAVVGAPDPDSSESFATCIISPAGLRVDTLLDPSPNAGEVGKDGKQTWPLKDHWFPRNVAEEWMWSRELYAAVLLGTSGGSWVNAEGDHWICKRGDLSVKGEDLVASLEKLYKQPVALLTFLDT